MEVAATSVGDDLRPALERSVRSIAEHVLAVAWPTSPVAAESQAVHLRQINGQRRPNELIRATATASDRADTIGARTPPLLRQADAAAHERAVRRIVRQLVHYPLAMLHRTDADAPDFLYRSWPSKLSPRAIARSQGSDEPTIEWLPGVPGALLSFSALVRPLIELAFVRDVASWNALDTAESRLHAHLSGAEREPWPAGLKEELPAVQAGGASTTPTVGASALGTLQIDHFLPWVRSTPTASPISCLRARATTPRRVTCSPLPDTCWRWLSPATGTCRTSHRYGRSDGPAGPAERSNASLRTRVPRSRSFSVMRANSNSSPRTRGGGHPRRYPARRASHVA